MGIHTLNKGLIYTAVLFCLIFIRPAFADIGLTGNEGDGSRAIPVHFIPLIDEEGEKITPGDRLLLPFSARQSCGLCHDYEKIGRGWHFNAAEPNVFPGRTGQPWIFVDAGTATQIPLSYRIWPGTLRPEQVGLTPWKFVQVFGRQMPGGGVGEIDSDNPDEVVRGFVSGKLEINCMACHDADPAHDQAEYAVQIARQNFRWAAAATCGFASVTGYARNMPNSYDPLMPQPLDDPRLIPPAITYNKSAFDYKNLVFFDVVRKIPAERCYFCHSNYDITEDGSGWWTTDEDVHLAAGLTCVDCHRNGLDHNITRGYQGEALVSKNPLAATSSCESCHIEGRLGATKPIHKGIPPAHFDKLTCTACHSGSLPGPKTIRTKTARAHGLGTYNINKSDDVLPHIIYPVFARQDNGKIGPYKLIWPAFWASLKGRNVTPMTLEIVRPIVCPQEAGEVIDEKLPSSGDWPNLTGERIEKVLELLKSTEGEAVYICGGKLYRLDNNGKLIAAEDSTAWPYLWPIAHDTRPVAQSLGARRCQDCHSIDSPFFFADVEVDSPIASEKGAVKKMIEFQGIDPVYMKLFSFSFIFRPYLEVIAIFSSAILAAVLLLYALKALTCIAKVLVDRD